MQDDQDVLYKVEQVAATDTNVLVLGETGTGKELISRAIHNNSLRKARPLVKVNCATLPSNLIESKLHLADDLARPAHKEMPTPLKSLQAIETDYIVRVLQETNWRIDGAQGAALILDMNPSTLCSRLRKLGIKKPEGG